MAKSKSKTTLDTLAQMVAKGFESAATKEDLTELATKKELSRIEAKMDLGFDDLGKKIEKVDSRVDEVYEIFQRFDPVRNRARACAPQRGLGAGYF